MSCNNSQNSRKKKIEKKRHLVLLLRWSNPFGAFCRLHADAPWGPIEPAGKWARYWVGVALTREQDKIEESQTTWNKYGRKSKYRISKRKGKPYRARSANPQIRDPQSAGAAQLELALWLRLRCPLQVMRSLFTCSSLSNGLRFGHELANIRRSIPQYTTEYRTHARSKCTRVAHVARLPKGGQPASFYCPALHRVS